MMQDMQGIEQYEQQIDYFEELKKVEDRVANQKDPKVKEAKKLKEDVEEGLEEDYLMDNIMENNNDEGSSSGQYVREY